MTDIKNITPEQDPTQASAKITPEQKAQQDVANAVECLAEMGERFAYGGVAFGVTVVVMRYGFNAESVVEPAMLNAAVAYYSHAASGRVIRALVVLARRPVGRFTVNPATQKVTVEDENATTSR